MKHMASGGLSDAKVEAGVDALSAAVQGDPAQYDVAEQLFLDAASVSITDPYPMFLVRTGQRLEEPKAGELQDEIAAAVKRQDWEEVDRKIADLERSAPQPAALWRRFVRALRLRLQ